MAVHCPECGFVNPEGANYCQKCGAYLGRPEEGDEPSTMTYKVDETGEYTPIDIDEEVDRLTPEEVRWGRGRHRGWGRRHWGWRRRHWGWRRRRWRRRYWGWHRRRWRRRRRYWRRRYW